MARCVIGASTILEIISNWSATDMNWIEIDLEVMKGIISDGNLLGNMNNENSEHCTQKVILNKKKFDLRFFNALKNTIRYGYNKGYHI